MTDAADAHDARRIVQRLTPDRVRSMRFTRTPIGRRGLAEDERPFEIDAEPRAELLVIR